MREIERAFHFFILALTTKPEPEKEPEWKTDYDSISIFPNPPLSSYPRLALFIGLISGVVFMAIYFLFKPNLGVSVILGIVAITSLVAGVRAYYLAVEVWMEENYSISITKKEIAEKRLGRNN